MPTEWSERSKVIASLIDCAIMRGRETKIGEFRTLTLDQVSSIVAFDDFPPSGVGLSH